MKYHVIAIGDKELKCRLRTQDITALEKKLDGQNILKVIMDEQIPSLTVVLHTLHASLQALEHGYTMEEVYRLYDAYVEEGKTYTDLLPELMTVLEVSGFFKKPPTAKEAATEPATIIPIK